MLVELDNGERGGDEDLSRRWLDELGHPGDVVDGHRLNLPVAGGPARAQHPAELGLLDELVEEDIGVFPGVGPSQPGAEVLGVPRRQRRQGHRVGVAVVGPLPPPRARAYGPQHVEAVGEVGPEGVDVRVAGDGDLGGAIPIRRRVRRPDRERPVPEPRRRRLSRVLDHGADLLDDLPSDAHEVVSPPRPRSQDPL